MQMVNRVTPEVYKVIIAIVDERIKEFHISREDFHELKETVERLAQAQAKTEEGMRRLEKAIGVY